MPEKKDNALKKAKLYEIDGVEIFASGTWNGDQYSEVDLDLMVEAFEETKGTMKPFAKLGHDDGQKLAQKDGFPAVGWIKNVYRKGKKLIADFEDVPEKIYQLLMNKAYRRVSSEIYWNMKLGEKTYKRVLSAVAFLGGDTPAVTSLDDVLNLYGLNELNLVKYNIEDTAHIYNLDQNEIEGEKMSEETKKPEENKEEIKPEVKEEIEEEKKENKEEKEVKTYTEKEVSELKEYKEKTEKELSTLKEYKEKSEEEKKKLFAEKIEAEKETFLNDLINEKLIVPSAKEDVKKLLTEENKEELKKIFSLHKEAYSSVNFDDNSQKSDNVVKDLDSKVKKYAKENKISYKEAYLIVSKENKESEDK